MFEAMSSVVQVSLTFFKNLKCLNLFYSFEWT
jgi:hypothetical protein